MGYVIAGRLTIAKGHAPADVDAALASFERVPRLFPGSDAVPAAGFYAGDTLLLARRTDEALSRFSRVAMEYPRSIWAARATLGAAAALAQSDRATAGARRPAARASAVSRFARGRHGPELQHDHLPALRPRTAQPPYGFSGRYVGTEANKFRDVVGVTIDDSGRSPARRTRRASRFSTPRPPSSRASRRRTCLRCSWTSAAASSIARRVLLITDGGETMTIARASHRPRRQVTPRRRDSVGRRWRRTAIA